MVAPGVVDEGGVEVCGGVARESERERRRRTRQGGSTPLCLAFLMWTFFSLPPLISIVLVLFYRRCMQKVRKANDKQTLQETKELHSTLFDTQNHSSHRLVRLLVPSKPRATLLRSERANTPPLTRGYMRAEAL